MDISTEELFQIHDGISQQLSQKDAEIARLKAQVAQLTDKVGRAEQERDFWRAKAERKQGERLSPEQHRFIIISIERLKALLVKIRNVELLSFLLMILQKALPKDAPAEDHKEIAELVPVPELPSISLTAEGDIEVGGDWNDVHDNGVVNF